MSASNFLIEQSFASQVLTGKIYSENKCVLTASNFAASPQIRTLLTGRSNKTSNKKPKSGGDHKGNHFCLVHGNKSNHTSDQCYTLKRMAEGAKGSSDGKSKSRNKTWTKKASDSTDKTKKEMNTLVKQAIAKGA